MRSLSKPGALGAVLAALGVLLADLGHSQGALGQPQGRQALILADLERSRGAQGAISGGPGPRVTQIWSGGRGKKSARDPCPFTCIYAVSQQVYAKGMRQQKGEEGGSGAHENDFLIDFDKKP